MVVPIRRFINQFFRKSRSINNKPLNALSLIVIVIVDIFILFNVFTGLDNISRWHLSPTEAYPCISEWSNYRDPKRSNDKKYQVVSSALKQDLQGADVPLADQNPDQMGSSSGTDSSQSRFQKTNQDRLGTVSSICSNYAELQAQVNLPEYRQLQQKIDKKQQNVVDLEQENSTIRSQYNSALLEKIARQGSKQSIIKVSAEKAQQTLAQNQATITTFKQEISTLKDTLISKPASINLIELIKDESKYQILKDGKQQSSFWYPSIQLAFQALFLLPLITIAFAVHKFALRKGAGLIALISWHLLAIFLIPLLLKIFEFLQIGAIFQFLLDIVMRLFGGLLFLVSYLYILIIPLVGFAIIKISQRFTASSKPQDIISKRFQSQLCLRCSQRVRDRDSHCPHCGYGHYLECQNCQELTYKHLSHCKQCGSPQDPQQSLADQLPIEHSL